MPRNARFPDGRFLLAAPLANEGRPRVVGDAHRWGRGLEPFRPSHVTRPGPNPALARARISGFGRLKNQRERRCHRTLLGPGSNLTSSHPLCGKGWARFNQPFSTLHLWISHYDALSVSVFPLHPKPPRIRQKSPGPTWGHGLPHPSVSGHAGGWGEERVPAFSSVRPLVPDSLED